MGKNPRDTDGLCGGSLLEEFAAILAAEHKISTDSRPRSKLLLELEEKIRQLHEILVKCEELKAGQYRDESLKWLLDNIPTVEGYLHGINDKLPTCNYDELPTLVDGDFKGFPRVYGLAGSFIVHLTNRLDVYTLKRFVLAYQSVTPLTTREIWSLATALWWMLAENLQCIAIRVVKVHKQSDARNDNLLEVYGLPHKDLAALQGKMENILAGMRSLSTVNWSALFESVSPVDRALADDPSKTYPLMDYATRDCYRRVIEHISKRTNLIESTVAQRAVGLAEEACLSYPDHEHLAHVGYYLIDSGRPKLEERIGYHPTLSERFIRIMQRNSTAFYMGQLSLLTLLILTLFILFASALGASALMLSWLSMLLIIPASELALSALIVIFLSKPVLLPKMDFTCGIPEGLQTMVVVPAIFSSETTIEELLVSLETNYLTNQDENIFFALLGDWSDSFQEKEPTDDTLLDIAINGIRNLNALYCRGPRARFYLFHRRRQWNHSEERWMGWERKRGKLREFNRLLRGACDTSYILSTADQAFLAQTRYVITLDSDTIISREAARRLIATISHPLNRPKLDISLSRVSRGYVIMQPQLNPLPPGSIRSRIPKILSNYIRLDPITIAPWNLYQDIFREGLYVGKGLYDIDAFESMLKDRVPENSLLSHDIYESLYARTALVADVVVHESFPPQYNAVKNIFHRWTRGDWQVLPWLMPYVRDAYGKTVRNVLPAIACWKILDPLRGSLFMPTVLLWMVAAWTALPGSPILWTLLILLVVALSIWLPGFKLTILSFRREAPKNNIFRYAVYMGKLCIAEAQSIMMGLFFFIVMLADQSYYRIDAIVRTLYRMAISRKHLLEWVVATQTREYIRYTPYAYVRHMWPAIIIALIAGALIFIKNPTAFIPAASIIIAWCVSPLVAYWMDNRNNRHSITVESQAERNIRINGRRKWQELEHYITSNDNHQRAPACIQEYPAYVNHHTTLSVHLLRRLLWNVAAHDLGCSGTMELAERLDNILVRIIKHQTECVNHCNCDNTVTLNLPTPAHIVAIENGNLAGHFTTLKHVFTDIVNRPLLNERALRGVVDTIFLMAEEVEQLCMTKPVKECAFYRQLHEEIVKCAEIVSPRGQIELPQTVAAWSMLLTSLTQQAAIVDEKINISSRGQTAGDSKLHYWADSFIHQTREFKRDLDILAPIASVCDSKTAALGGLEYTIAFDCVPALSAIPEVAGTVLNNLTMLRDKCISISEACPADVLSAFNAQISAIEEALEASVQLLSRYTQLANQSEAVMDMVDYGPLLDAEYHALFVNLQFSSTNKTSGHLF